MKSSVTRTPLSRAVFYLLVGGLCSFVFTLPLLVLAGWLFSAVVHEAGHWLCGLALGMPGLPRISLDGQAVTVALEQWTWLAGLLWIALGLAGWWLWRGGYRVAAYVGGTLFVLYPLVAFWMPARMATLTMAGHFSEWVFGGIFLWRAASGIAVQGAGDRLASAFAGWWLIGSNIVLFAGIFFSPRLASAYTRNISLGVENDLVVLADQWGIGLRTAAACSFVGVMAVLIVTLGWAFWEIRQQASPIRFEK